MRAQDGAAARRATWRISASAAIRGTILVALLWCRLAAPHANVTTVHLSIPFEDGARTLVWRRAAESAKEACARFAAEQGLNGDVLPDLEALVASQTALRKVSPSLFAAPSWWRPAEAAGTIAFFGGHDASVAVAAADGTLLCVLELERLFNDRYYSSFGPDGATPRESFDEDWRRALLALGPACSLTSSVFEGAAQNQPDPCCLPVAGVPARDWY